MSEYDSSTHLQKLLDLLREGQDSAREALLQHALDRFRRLAQKMFRSHHDLRGIAETDDVVQEALVRLHRALVEVKPTAVRAFFALAARQIRWVLQDLARKYAVIKSVTYTGRTVPGRKPNQEEPEDTAGEPSDLLEWSQFHEKIGALPDEQREMFDLLLYEGLTQLEAAALLQVSLRTIKRRWQRAKLLLREALRGDWPPPS